MMNLLLFFIMTTMISMIMLSINFMLTKKLTSNREKNSSFECGFDPISNARFPFSVQFFLISLMFLIFDIEITLLIPFSFTLLFFNMELIFSCIFFLLILIVSIYIEYSENMLEWK